MGFQCNTCGCNDNNEIDTQQQVETGKDVNNQGDNDRARNLNQMEKQGMSSVNNRKSRTKDVSNYDNT